MGWTLLGREVTAAGLVDLSSELWENCRGQDKVHWDIKKEVNSPDIREGALIWAPLVNLSMFLTPKHHVLPWQKLDW